MYSRLALITNEIAGLGSEEMTDKFIIKKILMLGIVAEIKKFLHITKINLWRD